MKVGEWDSELMGKVLKQIALDPETGNPKRKAEGTEDPRMKDLYEFFNASSELKFFIELLGMLVISSPTADTYLKTLTSMNITMFYIGYRYHEHEILEAIQNSRKEPHK